MSSFDFDLAGGILFVFWLYAGITIVIAALAIGFFFYRRSRAFDRNRLPRARVSLEAADELGAPPEAIDPDEAFRRDRQAGVSRPRAIPAEKRRLRTDNLSKEVELAWEAAEIIDSNLGAMASPHEAAEVPKPTARRERARVVLMARDPRWLYAYWDVREKYLEMQKKRVDEWSSSRPVLRLYNTTPGSGGGHTDISLNDDADSWYIHIDEPNVRLVAEIGRLFPTGFTSIARSNEVTMPPYGVSMEIAEEWAPFAWDSYYGKAGEPSGISSSMVWGRPKE